MSSGEGFFLEKLMILVIFFPAARLIEPFRSAKPLFLLFPGRRTGWLCVPSTPWHPPSLGEDAPQLWCTQLAPPAGEQPAWLGPGAVPCSLGSLRAAGEPVSPVTTLSESEVCFSCDSRCGGSGAGTLSAASSCTAPSDGHYRPFIPPAQGWDTPRCQGSPINPADLLQGWEGPPRAALGAQCSP